MKILIKDEKFGGHAAHEIEVTFEIDLVTVKDIISNRVKAEVEFYNNKQPEYFNGLVEPSNAEKTLNGYKLKKKQMIDAEQQVYIALAAFQNNRFFILVDNQQLEELDQQVRLTEQSLISFIKLTQLVGG